MELVFFLKKKNQIDYLYVAGYAPGHVGLLISL